MKRGSEINEIDAVRSADDFKRLERARLRALVDRDFALADRLHADDFHLITPKGTTYGKAEYLGAVEARELEYLRWTPGEIDVHLFAEVAILRYMAELEMAVGDRERVSFHCWHTDTYEVRRGAWQVVWSQATLVR